MQASVFHKSTTQRRQGQLEVLTWTWTSRVRLTAWKTELKRDALATSAEARWLKEEVEIKKNKKKIFYVFSKANVQ